MPKAIGEDMAMERIQVRATITYTLDEFLCLAYDNGRVTAMNLEI